VQPSFIERLLQKLLVLGIYLKGIDGVLEVVGGIMLWAVPNVVLDRTLHFLTQRELAEDPRDVVANWLVGLTSVITPNIKLIVGIFLIVHGLAKIFLAAGLIKEKAWAYPASISIFLVFIIYELYRLSYNRSFILGSVALGDIILLILIYHQYRHLRRSSV